MERDFKGIWIPKEIWLNKNLTVMEKLFLTEVDSLDNENGCFASNDYFSDFFGLSKNRCSEIIKSLEKKELFNISYIYRKGTKSIEKRIIKVLDTSIKCNRETDRGTRKTENTYSEKGEDNNTSINNKVNKDIPYLEIVEYLNIKANTKYKATSNKTKDTIKARFNESFTLEDFKKVIDIKTTEWLLTDMYKFLRPETLFGNKFEGYLNQKPTNKPITPNKPRPASDFNY